MSSNSTPSMVIIGAGRVGQSLGHLWVLQHSVDLLAVCNRSITSAQLAVDFIGSGEAFAEVAALPLADIYCVTTPDEYLADTAKQLVSTGKIRHNTVVMHCSGCSSSSIFQSVLTDGGHVVSVHPVYSFSNPTLAIERFVGTLCGYEGNPAAISIVKPLFESIGAKLFALKGECKTHYHTGLVMASNYAVSLLDAAAECLCHAGISQENALDMAADLMLQAATNVKHSHSTQAALTGPIARADCNIVAQQIMQLGGSLQDIYRVLGQRAACIASHPSVINERLLSLLDP